MAIFKVGNINPNPRQAAVGKVWKKQTNKQLSPKEEGMTIDYLYKQTCERGGWLSLRLVILTLTLDRWQWERCGKNKQTNNYLRRKKE